MAGLPHRRAHAKERLVHRFGLDPTNILTLENQAATRQNLLDTLESHLIDQGQAGGCGGGSLLGPRFAGA